MKRTLLATTILPLCLLASCATLQTNKNVRLIGTSTQGQELTLPSKIYYSNGQWFLPTRSVNLRKHYPTIDDTVFLTRELPYYKPLDHPQTPCFVQISAGTAKVLRDPQGYVSLPVLQSEVEQLRADFNSRIVSGSPSPLALSSLPNAQSFPVKAQFAPGDASCYIPDELTTTEPNTFYKVLAAVDMIVIDAPGTFIYNVAIPFMAPFYFFSSVKKDLDKDPFH